MRLLQIALAVGLVSSFAVASNAQKYAIIGATVHPLTGVGALDGATVLIEDGVISAIGVDVELPAGIEIIDGTGKVVTPGMFDAFSSLGLVEVSAVDGSIDSRHEGRFGAGLDVADAINPRTTAIGVNRIEGLTRALVVPGYAAEGKIIAGQAAAIHLGSDDKTLVARGAAVVAYLGELGGALAGGSRAGALGTLREALQDAEDYNRNRQGYEEGNRRDYSIGRLDLDSLLPVVSGRTPLVVYANRVSDIEALLELRDEFDLNLVIVGAAEAWLLADALAQAGVAVIIDPLANLPDSFESLNATLENAALLQQAGVMVAFSEADSHNSRNLKQAAGNAVANGLPWEEALRAITINPATIFGLDDDYGTLEVGRDADLVVWSGDPLEVTTFADHVFIKGKPLMMRSRQTLLRDRYLKLDGKWPPAYPQ